MSFQKKNLETFLEYCDITEEHFWEVIESWRSPDLLEMKDGKYKLKYQVV